MSDLILKDYEISLWDDVLTWVVTDSENNSYTSTSAPETVQEGDTVSQFFDEVKLCTIGSNTMTSIAKANNPIFTENTNGTKQLTFSLVTKYFDNDIGDYRINPFINLLVNERKVKLHYNDEWYDLIIKNIQENANGNSYSYTAQSAPINELSKTGFNLEFDTELENNMGTITDLAAQVVEGTDWTIDYDNSDLLQQYIEEPLYEYFVPASGVSAVETLSPTTSVTLTAGSAIYIFYSQLQQQSDDSYLNPIQAILPTLSGGVPLINDDRVMIDGNGEYAKNITVTLTDISLPLTNVVLSDYRGMRLNRNQTTVYDANIKKYVTVYTDSNNDTYYCYKETQYISPVIVQNYIVNSESFTSVDGWDCNVSDTVQLKFEEEPVINSYLEFTSSSNNYLYNSGIYNMRSSIHDFVEGESFVLQINTNANTATNFSAVVAPYVLSEGVYTVDTTNAILSFTSSTSSTTVKYLPVTPTWNGENTYYYLNSSGQYVGTTVAIVGVSVYYRQATYLQYTAQCATSKSYSELLSEQIGFFIKNNNASTWSLYDCALFRLVEDNGSILQPGAAPTQEVINIVPRYYSPAQTYQSLDDLVFVDGSDLTPVFDDNYEKIRSITIKESNRYNIIQTLCETFECWAKFTVEHDPETGKIVLEDYVPKKSISFHKYIGDDNYAGFRYGVNLKDITRTLVSDQLVTKIIVKANSNEFATNKFCTIARASENYPKETFILDFIHYIRQGLLSETEITNDLYLDTNGYIGYYKKLADLNKERDEYIDQLTEAKKVGDQLAASHQVATLAYESAEKLYNEAMQDYVSYKGTAYPGYDESAEDPMVQDIQTAIEVQKQTALLWKSRLDALNVHIAANDDTIAELEDTLYGDSLSSIATQKKNLNEQFYKKYSRFIQEGSWISEDYVDDNLYFIDAQNTLRTSAEPQVQYNISVMALNALDDYKSYDFRCGDKTYVEDEEYFGYTWVNGVKTPYHEEVIVSAVQWNLENPSNNTITVQNFKTRFQDLFQRITAQTQSLQYSTGAYNKAAGIVTTNGTINSEVLGGSLINSNLILSNARDQSVVTDSSGITVTNLTNYKEIVRLVSGGIFLSNDGGQNWNNAITGNGINANYITAGQIDTALIRVGSSDFPSFRWDANGLVSYAFSVDSDGNPYNFLFNKLVRFDQYGLYGYIGDQNFVPSSLADVWDNAQFALTWDGFKINSDNNGGYISITSGDDIQVFDSTNERIKIGRISEDGAATTIYGIRISNDDAEPVLITGSDGNLWLENILTVGDGSSSTVAIGYNTEAVRTGTSYHEVINANDDFVVYEDGYLKATNAEIEGTIIANSGEFHGDIYASGGQIGNMTIASLIAALGSIKISANNNTTITKIINNSSSYSLSSLTLTTALTHASGGVYSWYINGALISNETASSIAIDIPSYLDDDHLSCLIEVRYTIGDEVLKDNITLNLVVLSDEVDIDTYKIDFNDTKISKLYEENNLDTLVVTPQPLTLQIFENNTVLTQSSYYYSLDVIYNNTGTSVNIIADSSTLADTPFYSPLDSSVIYYNTDSSLGDTNAWFFDVSSIVREDLTGLSPTQEYLNLKECLLSNQGTLRFNFYKEEDDSWFAMTDILVTSAMYQALMDFAITAQAINASIGANAMVFDENGLTIRNGNFRIQRYDSNTDTSQDLLYFDNSTQELVIEGSGTFSGTVHATDGEFTGTIVATDGVIQKLKIGDNSNYLELGNLDDFTGIRSSNNSFSIDENGYVIAENINLGTGAQINQYIKLGNAYIWNPQYEDNSTGIVFSVQNTDGENTIAIYENGTGTIGDLTFDGNTSTLTGAGGGEKTWSIDPENARFFNIYAQGTISTAVFESSSTRVSGGSMIFKNGAVVTEVNGNVLTVEDPASAQQDDYVWAIADGSSLSTVTFAQITNIDGNYITLNTAPSTQTDTLIILGPATGGYLNDWIIGVNSSRGDYSSVGLHRNSLNFVSASIDDQDQLVLTNEIVLGDLTGLNFGNVATASLSGSGLYAQNVYLTGSLTTQYNTQEGMQYAGVNTFGVNSGKGVAFNKSSGTIQDTSNIVFWAGASGIESTNIQNSLFQVTADGTLYAQQGYFVGSILTDATIEAGELITPIITGKVTDSDSWMLTLRTPTSTETNGFIFLNDDATLISFTSIQAYFNTNMLFDSTKSIGFSSGVTSIGNNDIISNQLHALNNDTKLLRTTVLEDAISFESRNSSSADFVANGIITYNNDALFTYIQDNPVTSVTENNFTSLEDTYLNKSIYFGYTDQENRMVYKPVNSTASGGAGYDLYVAMQVTTE